MCPCRFEVVQREHLKAVCRLEDVECFRVDIVDATDRSALISELRNEVARVLPGDILPHRNVVIGRMQSDLLVCRYFGWWITYSACITYLCRTR